MKKFLILLYRRLYIKLNDFRHAIKHGRIGIVYDDHKWDGYIMDKKPEYKIKDYDQVVPEGEIEAYLMGKPYKAKFKQK